MLSMLEQLKYCTLTFIIDFYLCPDSVIRSPPLDSMEEEKRASPEPCKVIHLHHPSSGLYGTDVKLNVVSVGRKLFGNDLAIHSPDLEMRGGNEGVTETRGAIKRRSRTE